ncbi:MAG: endonuclease/exonuclease/phosphatase family protein [Chromatiales bacterium]|nr:endonuclease/exonuclease/phosphatase family protein [Chromatiales bacterium]
MLNRAYSNRLRLLSYNIQTGLETQHYGQYLTHSWKHVLPHRARLRNLNRIATLLGQYDIVGLQEVDSGSLRSGFVDQTEYLAHRAGFPHWHKQVNRRIGSIAQHSNGVLSRLKPSDVAEYRLPGLPGRGVIVCQYGGDQGLTVCIMHLALGRRARLRQIDFVSRLVKSKSHIVLMGDLNCSCESREMRYLMESVGLQEFSCEKSTFPSWRPMRRIDHILVSDSLCIENAQVLDYSFSDHLPISIDILIPEHLKLAG